jgi:hypothetical protein
MDQLGHLDAADSSSGEIPVEDVFQQAVRPEDTVADLPVPRANRPGETSVRLASIPKEVETSVRIASIPKEPETRVRVAERKAAPERPAKKAERPTRVRRPQTVVREAPESTGNALMIVALIVGLAVAGYLGFSMLDQPSSTPMTTEQSRPTALPDPVKRFFTQYEELDESSVSEVNRLASVSRDLLAAHGTIPVLVKANAELESRGLFLAERAVFAEKVEAFVQAPGTRDLPVSEVIGALDAFDAEIESKSYGRIPAMATGRQLVLELQDAATLGKLDALKRDVEQQIADEQWDSAVTAVDQFVELHGENAWSSSALVTLRERIADARTAAANAEAEAIARADREAEEAARAAQRDRQLALGSVEKDVRRWIIAGRFDDAKKAIVRPDGVTDEEWTPEEKRLGTLIEVEEQIYAKFDILREVVDRHLERERFSKAREAFEAFALEHPHSVVVVDLGATMMREIAAAEEDYARMHAKDKASEAEAEKALIAQVDAVEKTVMDLLKTGDFNQATDSLVRPEAVSEDHDVWQMREAELKEVLAAEKTAYEEFTALREKIEVMIEKGQFSRAQIKLDTLATRFPDSLVLRVRVPELQKRVVEAQKKLEEGEEG